jgi:putative hemolysin
VEIISKKDFSSATKLDKIKMSGLAPLLMEIMKINDVNKLYSQSAELQGLDFVDAILEGLGITIDVSENELKNIPKEGAFIAIANHPFGGVEGLILLKVLCSVRPDVKLMANFLLKKIPNLSDYFIGVNPFENVKNSSSISGVKNTLEFLQNGTPIGIFPAGEVSAYNTRTQKVMDKQWNPVVGKLISKSKVPVISVYFHGNNGLLFNILGLIHPTLRTAKLPSELFNKKGHSVKMRIGKPITSSELQSFTSNERLLFYLRAKTYALGSGIDVKRNLFTTNIFKINKKAEPIVEETPIDLIAKEIEKLTAEEKLIMSEKSYDVFLSSASGMPNILNEIGRLREITFREVGEGTNKKIDLDEFDYYYHHLFIWDREEKKLVGAYRVGKGDEIYYRYGIKGFYINSLFKIGKGMSPVLKEALELGRSFIRKEYQQKPLPLFLLWKGLLIFLLKNPDYRYMLGPVSISNNFSKISKNLIVGFLKQNCFDPEMAKHVEPRKKFDIDLPDSELLLEQYKSIKSLDSLISEIEITHNKVPVLLRQYVQLNAKLIGFNVDPKFSDSIDGFLVLDIHKVPEDVIQMLGKNVL